MDKEKRAALYACKQPNGKYRKEIENTGVFLSDIWEMLDYVAQQPNGQWQAFDYMPVLTEQGNLLVFKYLLKPDQSRNYLVNKKQYWLIFFCFFIFY